MHVQIPQWCEYVAFISALHVRERIACSLDNAIAAIAANTTTDTRIAVSSRGYCATYVSEMCRRVDGQMQRVVAALHRDLALRHADGLSRDLRRIRGFLFCVRLPSTSSSRCYADVPHATATALRRTTRIIIPLLVRKMRYDYFQWFFQRF
jgi:hypothetical protein